MDSPPGFEDQFNKGKYIYLKKGCMGKKNL